MKYLALAMICFGLAVTPLWAGVLGWGLYEAVAALARSLAA